jgi:sugar lactone lactonase YvrE
LTDKTQDYIPTHFAQSDYFINFPVLKSHNDGGITIGGKNHFGSLRIPTASGYYDMHATRATETPGLGHYRAIVDLLGHPKLGGKTILTLIDGLYSGRSWDSHPIRWDMAPFNGDWPSSIFLSQDPIAADSVAFDFMYNEWDADPGTINGYPHKSGAHDYQHEAALAFDPPSDANYDPNHDGGLKESLGVHEHWNNATDKQYSRNLDPVNGTGIELVTGPERLGDFDNNGRVDFKDFAVLAAAWLTEPGDTGWNADCDISMPSDDIIDELDLKVFCDNWLNIYVTDLIQPGATLTEVYSAASINFEGPTWEPASDKLFFTRRTGTYQILRLDSPGNVTVWLTPSPQTNGTIMSLDGRLLCCDESPKQISSRRIDPDGPGDTIILADSSDGFTKPPNDLCQLKNGNIYFTTPIWDSSPPSSQGVWLLEPDGTVTQVNNTLYQPNGIITSLDETKLYVSAGSTNTAYQQWWVFDINPDGTLSAGSVFFDPASPPDTTNVPDGMTIDELGNLYFTGLGGVWIVSPAGVQLDFISLPNAPFNIAFGGPNGRTLYMTCKNKVYSLAMCVRGGELESW